MKAHSYRDRPPAVAAAALTTVLAVSIAAQPASAQPTGVDRVAITPFTSISGTPGDEWIGAGIAATLAAELEQGGDLSVAVDQTSALADGSSPDAIIEPNDIGTARALGVRWIVSGGYQRLGEQMRITARVVEVPTGAVTHTAIVDGTVAELCDLQDRLAADLRRALTAGGSAAPAPAHVHHRQVQPPPALDWGGAAVHL